jgi:hypothetical protein
VWPHDRGGRRREADLRHLGADGPRVGSGETPSPGALPSTSATVAQVLVDAGHLAPTPNQPGVFALSDPARIETLVLGAGFEPPEITKVPMSWKFGSFEDYWAFTLDKAGALAMIIEQLLEAEQGSVRADGEFELDGLCLNVSTRSAHR